MTIDTWFLTHGESLQYLAYFGLLVPLALLERADPARAQDAPRPHRWRVNFTLTAINVVVLGALPVSFIAAAHWADARSLGLLRAYELPLALVIVANLLGRSFISWITHLLMHKVPLLWQVHRVHHSDPELDVSTTVRFHPLEFPIGLVIGLPLVVVFGLSAWILLAYEVLDVIVTLFSHANIELPRNVERWLRYVIVTPGLHRVHHSTRPEETDNNFGAVFPIWDLVFGTFRTHTETPTLTMPLGLSEVRESRPLWWVLGLPFRGRLDGGSESLRHVDCTPAS